VHIDSDMAGYWSVNGVALNEQAAVPVYVDIKVTEGTNSEQEIALMLNGTQQLLTEVLGTIQEACYVVVDAIPGSNWGYSGISQAARGSLRA